MGIMKKPEKSLLVSCIATGLVVLIVIISLLASWFQQGTLIVLSLTLVAVTWYTYFTYQLVMKKEQPVVVATIHYTPEAKDVRILINNPTNRYAKTRVWV
jgi:c-di-AMP phosphodiesterase-like protein